MTNSCPIWGTRADFYPTTRDGKRVTSSRTYGQYFISGSDIESISHWANDRDEDRIRLTYWLIEQRRLGNNYPEIINVENILHNLPKKTINLYKGR